MQSRDQSHSNYSLVFNYKNHRQPLSKNQIDTIIDSISAKTHDLSVLLNFNNCNMDSESRGYLIQQLSEKLIAGNFSAARIDLSCLNLNKQHLEILFAPLKKPNFPENVTIILNFTLLPKLTGNTAGKSELIAVLCEALNDIKSPSLQNFSLQLKNNKITLEDGTMLLNTLQQLEEKAKGMHIDLNNNLLPDSLVKEISSITEKFNSSSKEQTSSIPSSTDFQPSISADFTK